MNEDIRFKIVEEICYNLEEYLYQQHNQNYIAPVHMDILKHISKKIDIMLGVATGDYQDSEYQNILESEKRG